jgi:hypothetical protein
MQDLIDKNIKRDKNPWHKPEILTLNIVETKSGNDGFTFEGSNYTHS